MPVTLIQPASICCLETSETRRHLHSKMRSQICLCCISLLCKGSPPEEISNVSCECMLDSLEKKLTWGSDLTRFDQERGCRKHEIRRAGTTVSQNPFCLGKIEHRKSLGRLLRLSHHCSWRWDSLESDTLMLKRETSTYKHMTVCKERSRHARQRPVKHQHLDALGSQLGIQDHDCSTRHGADHQWGFSMSTSIIIMTWSKI